MPCYVARVRGAEPSDAELVRSITQQGPDQRRAELALCRRYAPRIRLYGLKHLRDRQRAEDLVQTVLVAVLVAARAGSIEDLAKLERFVLGTCRNTLLKMRSSARRETASSDEVLHQLSSPPFELTETAALLRCFDALDARAKQVVVMSFQEEHSAEEIARVLATTSGNVRVLRHRALHALRSCLDLAEGVPR